MFDTVRVVHISDLHIHSKLTLRQRQRGSVRYIPDDHDEVAATKRLQKALELVAGVDLLIVTGDISDDGLWQQFRTAHALVTDDTLVDSSGASIGLGPMVSCRVLVPGNHDRWAGLRRQSKENSWFEGRFRTGAMLLSSYPWIRGFRPREPGPTLLLVGFDSTRKGGWNPLKWFAAGVITKRARRALISDLAAAAQDGIVKDLDGNDMEFDPQTAIAVAMLHHHPIKDPDPPPQGLRRRAYQWTIGDRAMKLHGGKEFMAACHEAGVHVVLFGHKHDRYSDHFQAPSGSLMPRTGIHYFCCPSTMKSGEEYNGFYLHEFGSTQLTTRYWNSQGAFRDFEPDPEALSIPY